MNAKRIRITKNIVCTILIVLIFFITFITIVNFAFNSIYVETRVKGFSMLPTLNANVKSSDSDGDKIYINKYAPISLNDIVVAEVSWPGIDGYIIKRVVGTPGDKIEIVDEFAHFAVYVNDSLLYTKNKFNENFDLINKDVFTHFNDYLKFLDNPEMSNYVKEDPLTFRKYIQLGENDYLLVGDNWGHTTDCLQNGPVKTNNIVGRVDLIIDSTNTSPLTSTMFFLKNLFSFN